MKTICIWGMITLNVLFLHNNALLLTVFNIIVILQNSLERRTDSAKSRTSRWHFVSSMSAKTRGTMSGRRLCRESKRLPSGTSTEDLSEFGDHLGHTPSPDHDGDSDLAFYDSEYDNDGKGPPI